MNATQKLDTQNSENLGAGTNLNNAEEIQMLDEAHTGENTHPRAETKRKLSLKERVEIRAYAKSLLQSGLERSDVFRYLVGEQYKINGIDVVSVVRPTPEEQIKDKELYEEILKSGALEEALAKEKAKQLSKHAQAAKAKQAWVEFKKDLEYKHGRKEPPDPTMSPREIRAANRLRKQQLKNKKWLRVDGKWSYNPDRLLTNIFCGKSVGWIKAREMRRDGNIRLLIKREVESGEMSLAEIKRRVAIGHIGLTRKQEMRLLTYKREMGLLPIKQPQA